LTLAAGSRLGPYEILAPIGAGGMGEVYRALDPRLGREVAIKVLPASFSTDPDRLRRFEQEARAAGLLNHPNITAVYDIGSHEGAPYVVSELLEGETLRAALAEGKLSPRKATDYAIQTAHGLAAAHEKGIVHRDLKPENLFVTKDGRIKILDFGLAKLTRPEKPGIPLTEIPTQTARTEPGVVMGTAGYMSPEQIRGRLADVRSDIFSFGAILHEMLSGKRAFHGESAVETMNAILKEDPPDLSLADQAIPPGLERIVRHCLEKNPEQRFQSTRDLAFDLESLSGLSAPRLEVSTLKLRGRVPRLAFLAALLAALAIGLFAGRLVWKTGPLSYPSYRRLTFRRGPVWSARFAPDGQMIVYAAAWHGGRKPELFSVRVESPESLRLSLPARDLISISRGGEMLLLDILHFSPTGEGGIGTLSQMPLSGSAPRDLLEDVSAADWSPDGNALAVVRAPNWRYRLEFPVGKVLYETTGWISHPRVSPKGDSVAFLDHPVSGDDLGSVAIVDRSGKKRTLSTGWGSVQGLAWSASGDEIWFTAGRTAVSRTLYAVSLSGKQRTVATAPGGMMLQDVSRDRRALIIRESAWYGFLGLLPGETKERDFSGMDWSFGPLLSEDAKTLVFTEEGEGAGATGYSVYLRKLDGSPAVRLGEGQAMAISPDGKWILTCLMRSTPSPIVLLPTGAGEPKSFPKDSIDHAGFGFAAFLPDGKHILFVGREPGRPPRVFVQDLAGGAVRPITPEGVVASLLSPDGKTLLIRTPEQGFALTPLEGGPSRAVPGLEREDLPLRWASDGRALFVRHGRAGLQLPVFLVDTETGRREVWKEFRPADLGGITTIGLAAISADGKTMLFQYTRILSDLYLAEGLK
jgi:serine/threonine protein kinase/Tol biopolymer transport system component